MVHRTVGLYLYISVAYTWRTYRVPKNWKKIPKATRAIPISVGQLGACDMHQRARQLIYGESINLTYFEHHLTTSLLLE
jgi:hypothetical protein